MSTSRGSGGGICILSLDSGGPGTYSQLLILKECMNRMASDLGISEDCVYPADYFDLMGGVGFGGLVALMLGHFRMNINQAIESLLDVAYAVFPEGSQQNSNSKANSDKLKVAIEDMLQARQIPLDTKMNEPSRPQTTCKVVLYAATSINISHPRVFRTYSSRGSSVNPTIVEAICATISVPSHFMPTKIGPQRTTQNFIGGPLGANNPTRELLKEAGIAFGNDKRVAQIISIGCGAPHTLSLNEARNEVGVCRLLKEMAADCQMVAQELSSRLFSVEAYRRFDVDKGMENMEMDNWNVLGDIEAHTSSYIEADAVTKAVEGSLQCLQGRMGTATLGQINQSSSIKVAAKTAPAVSSHYIVRTKPWQIMVHHLVTSPSSRQRILPITGMGGCGKTQIVSYFLHEYPSLFTHVAFVDASSFSSAESDFQTWSRALGDGHERDVWEDGFRVLSNVPLNQRWALILDNADDPKLRLAPFMPKCVNLTIVVTSRNRDLGNLSTTHHLELGEMEEDEALATLLRAARRELPLPTRELESAHTLVKELGCLALALVQAGEYCHQLSSSTHGVLKPFTFTQYLSLFSSHRAELMKEPQRSSLDSYERGVYTTLDLSYRALSQLHREFLHFISFFHYADIPVTALAIAANNRFTDKHTYLPRPESHKKVVSDLSRLLCEDGKWSELRIQSIIRTLQAFSLLSATSVNDSVFLQLHPLIQAWSRDMVLSTSGHYRAMSVQVVTACWGGVAFRLKRFLLAHILDLLAGINVPDLHVNEQVAVAGILKDYGYYQNATGLLKAALADMSNCTELDQKETLEVTAELASVYSREGKLGDAEKLRLEVLEQQRKLKGMEHSGAIAAVGDLAAIYWKQGRHAEAEKLQLEVLEQRRKTQGMEHPDTIQAAASLAATYSRQGRHSEAEKLTLEVLGQYRRMLGLEHPVAIRAAANLALIYWKQGRHSEAEKLTLKILEQQRRVLGLEHPDTLQSATNLASTYGKQARYDEALELLAPAVKLSLKVLGQQHPSTQNRIKSLTRLYEKLGKRTEAEETRKLVIP